MFVDTAVALKPTQTPVCTKKLKPDGVAGCTTLPRTTAALGLASTTITDVISQVASQVTVDTSESQAQGWAMSQLQSQLMKANTKTAEKVTIQDVNQNSLFAHIINLGTQLGYKL